MHGSCSPQRRELRSATTDNQAIRPLEKSKPLAFDGETWIGHVCAAREDFRGIDALEAFVVECGFDKALAAQTKSTTELLNAWYGDKSPKDKYEAIVSALPKAFLVDGLPSALREQLEAWHEQEKQLGVSKKAIAAWSEVEAWRDGWDAGRKQYASLWKEWKLPGD